jgi:cytochrome c oxidase assembly protein subunit 15
VSPRTFSAVAAASLGLLCTIVLTGALVRLTGSGLGCTDWPNCNSQKFVDVSSGHAAIEQLNRLFTGCVSAAVIAAVLTSYLRRPRRRDLVLLSWGLVVGVLAQIVIGAVVVVTGLNPWANMAHFLVSMFLIACAFMLERSSRIDSVAHVLRRVPAEVLWLHRTLVASASVAIVTGTVVTATGPHAGAEDAVRFGFDLVSVARVHSVTVIATVAVLVASLVRLRSSQGVEARSARQALGTMAFVALLQGAVGYLQYFTGVPVVLVGFHIAGATAFWLCVCNVFFAPRPDEVLPVS